MRKVRIRGRVLVIAAVATGVLSAAGTALAAFQATGAATVATTSGSVQMPTASGTVSGGLKLYPGSVRNLKVVVTNPNDFPVRVTKVARSSSPVQVDAAHAAGCVQTGVLLPNPSYAVSWAVPAGATRTFTLTNGLKMTNASNSGCQNATFTVPVTITATAS